MDPFDVGGTPFWETPWWAHSATEQEKLRDGIRRASRGEPVHFETTHVSADGTVRSVDFTLKPARDKSGRPFCLIAEARDVTEAKRTQEEHRASESMLSGVFRATPIGITFNIARVIHSANDSMCELTGYGEHELVGKSARIFYDSQEEFERVGRELYQQLPQKGRMSVETRFRRKDGTAIFVILTAAMLNPGNPSSGYVVTVHDITERKGAEEALREREDLFRGMLEQSPFSMQVLSPDGEILEVNQAFERLWGVDRETMIGYNLLHDHQIEELGFMPVVRRAFAGERVSTPVVEYDARASVGKGTRRVVQGVFYPVRDANGVISRVILVHLDLTERRRAEEEKNKLQEQLQQAMKMEAVGRLAGGIAHDFNNLLTTIAGNAELARMDTDSAGGVAQLLDEISKAAESAASLTRQLLSFSRRQIIEPRALNLNDLVENLNKMLARLIGEDVELKAVLGDDLGSVTIDPGQFEQVLVNLAVNARDAMPDGGTLIIETSNAELDEEYCSRHPEARPGRHVLLTVSDTGHGMSEEVKTRIFEPFFTTKPKGMGTGLGLATIFGIVKQAGGVIEIYSEVRQGTTFKIYLPRIGMPPEKLTVGKPSNDLPTGKETILLVEDETSVRGLACAILDRLGYKVLRAANGIEAIQIAQRHGGPIDLLLTDVVMPGMNGRELAERLLRTHPEMKVLYASGYTEDVIVHRGVLEEHLHFIGKPYSLHSLSEKIRETLDP
jgi:PAS domain S-box-containing protein